MSLSRHCDGVRSSGGVNGEAVVDASCMDSTGKTTNVKKTWVEGLSASCSQSAATTEVASPPTSSPYHLPVGFVMSYFYIMVQDCRTKPLGTGVQVGPMA